jgi:excisionase family DNA binding protein
MKRRSPDTPPASRIAAPSSGRLWGIDDIAAYLAVSRRGVERLISAGRLPAPCVRVGRLPRWRPETIREWAETGGRP